MCVTHSIKKPLTVRDGTLWNMIERDERNRKVTNHFIQNRNVLRTRVDTGHDKTQLYILEKFIQVEGSVFRRVRNIAKNDY